MRLYGFHAISALTRLSDHVQFMARVAQEWTTFVCRRCPSSQRKARCKCTSRFVLSAKTPPVLRPLPEAQSSSEAFISRLQSDLLDLSRWVAAFLVVLGHAR